MHLSTHDRQAIEDLLTELFWRQDHEDACITELFMAEARLEIDLQPPVQGGAAIEGFLGARPAGITSRHVWSSFRIQSVTQESVSGSFTVVSHVRFADAATQGIIDVTAARFARDESKRWRIAEMRVSTVVQPQNLGW